MEELIHKLSNLAGMHPSNSTTYQYIWEAIEYIQKHDFTVARLRSEISDLSAQNRKLMQMPCVQELIKLYQRLESVDRENTNLESRAHYMARQFTGEEQGYD